MSESICNCDHCFALEIKLAEINEILTTTKLKNVDDVFELIAGTDWVQIKLSVLKKLKELSS